MITKQILIAGCANTQREVGDALEVGRAAVGELEALAKRQLPTDPALAKLITRCMKDLAP